MIDEITTRTEKAIREKVFPGCVIGVITHDKKSILPFGRFTYENDSIAVKEDTVYDLASLTKMIVASSSLLVLVDRGDIKLNDRVVDFLPEFNSREDKDKVLVKHLLTYTLNLHVPSTSSLKDKTPDEIVNSIVQAPLKAKPGSMLLYVNSTAMIMGILVNSITGVGLDVFSEDKFFLHREKKLVKLWQFYSPGYTHLENFYTEDKDLSKSSFS